MLFLVHASAEVPSCAPASLLMSTALSQLAPFLPRAAENSHPSPFRALGTCIELFGKVLPYSLKNLLVIEKRCQNSRNHLVDRFVALLRCSSVDSRSFTLESGECAGCVMSLIFRPALPAGRVELVRRVVADVCRVVPSCCRNHSIFPWTVGRWLVQCSSSGTTRSCLLNRVRALRLK